LLSPPDVGKIETTAVLRKEVEVTGMRANVELDDTLVKKALINKALEELIKSNTRKGMLKFIDSGIWQGDLKEMRAMR
jgi:polysaccharide deacetylase 2 family uncharacterized protein YibQ